MFTNRFGNYYADPKYCGDMIEDLTRDLHESRMKAVRTERNRDMWEGQCERQATELAAMRSSLGNSVVVPRELTEAMRYATWKAQALHVGATELEAIQMANRRMTAEQREMDHTAYAAMLAAAPPAILHDQKGEAVSSAERGGAR
jgi:hypothetical protein